MIRGGGGLCCRMDFPRTRIDAVLPPLPVSSLALLPTMANSSSEQKMKDIAPSIHTSMAFT
jgi:hypothetical protein